LFVITILLCFVGPSVRALSAYEAVSVGSDQAILERLQVRQMHHCPGIALETERLRVYSATPLSWNSAAASCCAFAIVSAAS
jgi:hypothetical protein